MRVAPSADRCTSPGPKTRKRVLPILVNPWREPLTVELGLALFDALRTVLDAEERRFKFGAVRAARKSVLQGLSRKLGLPAEGKCKEMAQAIFEALEAAVTS